MSTTPRLLSVSPEDHLRAGICLLALITTRPANLDELLSEGDINDIYAEGKAVDDDDDTKNEIDEYFEGPRVISSNDEDEHSLHKLRDKVLDRLAETLARYKSDPRAGGGPVLDPKHVASTMMITYSQENKVKILCSKNEGLNQGNSTDDTDFLNSWKVCMERISKAGSAAENDKDSMLDLILTYQRPRINYYVTKLRHAFRYEESTKQVHIDKQPSLSTEWLGRLPVADCRLWIDDNGNRFKFSSHWSNNPSNNSRAASSAQSSRNVDDEVNTILVFIEKLCAQDLGAMNSSEFDICQESLLEQLLPAMFAVWKSARFQASIKARLHERFQHIDHAQRRKNDVMMALKFLCRVYYSLMTFIEAAESMPMFQSIECIPVFVPSTTSKKIPKAIREKQTPIEITTSLELEIHSPGWISYLQKKKTKETFKRLLAEKCHVHAEIQLLSHQKTSVSSRDKTGSVHPYIGCSKRCCLLCWLFIRTDASLQVRGSHETVMHRWEIPAGLFSGHLGTKSYSITKDFLSFIKAMLRYSFSQSFPLRPLELLAQSSAALSTTQTVLDREKAQMEKSELIIRRMMTMPMVTNDGILVVENHEKPGFVFIIGGSLAKPKEMTFEEAEIFKENHIRSLRRAEHVLSLESRDDDLDPLSESEKEILKLYSMLYRDFNNIPDSLTSIWFDFGFCFCRNHDQRKKLAKLYIQLVENGASIAALASAYESRTFSSFMNARGQDLSYFEANGILFHQPDVDELGIYRLIAEVNHTLSGCYCFCWRPKEYCHPKFETRLSRESDGDYGFHGTNPWERWQLLNFYKYVFQHPRFDAKAMQKAKRHPETHKTAGSQLERYLNELIPDFRRKVGNSVLGDAMFPKVKAKVEFPYGRPRCLCVIHNTVAPEGLCWATPWVLARGRGKAGGDEEVELRNLLAGT
ncbi:hypothetical protein PVAG01_06858 [Phlyctema vagabunda]|uniref:Uncharacterized protein n=1 Tax=Phlyctema vagabunda TaxID=108571 RepID=A0ABR4PHA1_9HELO